MSDIIAAADRFEKAVAHYTASGMSALDAFHFAQDRDAAGAESYRLVGTGVEALPEAEPAIQLAAHGNEPINLRKDESLPQLVARIAREQTDGDQRKAYHLVAAACPKLVENYANGIGL